MAPATLTNLPYPILDMIVDLLDSPETVYAVLPRVNRAFYFLIRSRPLAVVLHTQITSCRNMGGHSAESKLTYRLQINKSFITGLPISVPTQQHHQQMSVMRSNKPRRCGFNLLFYLHVEQLHNPDPRYLQTVLQKLQGALQSKLKTDKIVLCGWRVDIPLLFTTSPSALQHHHQLQSTSSFTSNDTNIQNGLLSTLRPSQIQMQSSLDHLASTPPSLLRNISSLKKLVLQIHEGCYDPFDPSPQLASRRNWLTRQILDPLSSLPNLEALTIVSNLPAEADFLAPLANASLKHLVMKDIRLLRGQSPRKACSTLSKLTSLETLKDQSVFLASASPSDLAYLLSSLTSLKR
ncbi:hypothetical protein HK102_003194, partial [Quaeritorhiza haematococci]